VITGASSRLGADLARRYRKQPRTLRPQGRPVSSTSPITIGPAARERPESTLVGGLFTASPQFSRDVTGPARTGRDRLGRDECSHPKAGSRLADLG
jgi:hypothetical protein